MIYAEEINNVYVYVLTCTWTNVEWEKTEDNVGICDIENN